MDDLRGGELVQKPLFPPVHHGFGIAFIDLIRGTLVGEEHQQVPQQHRVKELDDNGQSQLEPGVGFQTAYAEGDHRDVAVAAFLQGLPEQMDVVGGPAAAASLGDNQGGVV